MSGSVITESIVEEAALDWLAELGYAVAHGSEIAPEAPGAERRGFGDVVLVDRLRAALARINPDIPAEAREEALRQATRATSGSLVERNHAFHLLLTDGVPVEYRRAEGGIAGATVKLADFADPARNDWLAVNQFTVIEGKVERRPDIVIFLNGLPLGVIELKNPGDENATTSGAFRQLQTYQHDIPGLLLYNEVLVVSDGVEARHGTLTAVWERFMPWRTVDGVALAPKETPELEVLIKGIFERRRFLDLLRHFIVFEVDEASIEKKMAAYHQFHAINKAVAATLQAAAPEGNRRIGVVWHTQGSGKSLSMAFYAGKIILHPALANPTIVVLTDRTDLDDQLFGKFALAHDLLRQEPVHAEDREHLRDLLRVSSGGVIFTTIQKFLPSSVPAASSAAGDLLMVAEQSDTTYPAAPLTDRRNVVVIADEAHRSQYDFIDGFARHLRDALPNASYIGFTGTPIEASDRSTPAVFGDYIDVYDIQRAVADGVTVPIYYESRLAKLALDESEVPRLDEAFEEVTEGEELTTRERLKTKWARLEAVVGAPKRIEQVARDIVEHWEQRRATLDGKALIVCMSRRIAVALYDAIITLKPEWHGDDDEQGTLKIVMTGSASDPLAWQPHIRNKARREALAERFKNPTKGPQIVIVRDMWLTGFDAPCLHTMYVDKPMRGHGLMQALARVNRVFKDKPGGLVVDYLGLAYQLKVALKDYTEGDRSEVGESQEVAADLMREKYALVRGILRGFDYTPFFSGTPSQRLAVIPAAMEHILALEGSPDAGKKRFIQTVTELLKAFALAVPSDRALAIRDDVGFFQVVRAAFVKATPTDGKTQEQLDSAIQQLVSQAVVPAGQVMDVFAMAGLQKPDIAILSDEFLEEVRHLPQRNLALEVLEKLLSEQVKARARRNVVEARSFREMLERAITAYQNRALETAEIIRQLIALAKEMRAAGLRGEALGLTEDELAFYDALEVNDSAVKVLGDEKLREIARELVRTVRQNVTVDWTVRESARSHLRRVVKHLLRKYGYPSDKEETAARTVLEQAELLAQEWAA
jgi:type I restriction enzyme R subunit